MGIADVDTIRVMYWGTAERIRPYGFDYPERGPNFGTQASKFTSQMVFGEVFGVESVDEDRHGRTVAWVSANGKNVNKALLQAGLAWWLRRYAPNDADLAMMAEEDRAARCEAPCRRRSESQKDRVL